MPSTSWACITKRKRTEWELLERQKELQCLHDISTLKLLPDISFPVLMERITELIPPAWQFPEVTATRITLGQDIFQTNNFRVTPWIQTREIVVNSHLAGQLEVCYLEERPASDEGPFLFQERNLLNTIAQRIGSICASQQASAVLSESERCYAQLLGYSGSDTDITERKQTDEALLRRTTELLAINTELARFNRVAVGREVRIIDLKEEINELCRAAGQPKRYGTQAMEALAQVRVGQGEKETRQGNTEGLLP